MTATARLLSHELGHNIGMQHDFHKSHGGNNSPGSNTRGCEGEGLMSYGSKEDTWRPSKRPNAWSTCSNSDFVTWYKTKGHTCLRSDAGGRQNPGSGGSGECKSEPGYFGKNDAIVKGKPEWPGWPHQGVIRSAGPEDCAYKCHQVSGCTAWSLSRSNYCWLKKTNTHKVENSDFVRGKPCASHPKSCECNGQLNANGGGECNNVHEAACGRWCYVDDDAKCTETSPSHNSKYRWTCEACQGTIATRSKCTTTNGQACVFPFTFDGETHNKCITDTKNTKHETPWCSTKTDGEGVHIKGNFGDCSNHCPGSLRAQGYRGVSSSGGIQAGLMSVLMGLSVAVASKQTGE